MSMKRGFTLIELLVSVGIFTMVMVIALGSLLSISASDRKAETLKSVMNNLNFALDSMSRSIRTGINYSCDASGDCPNGGSSIAFTDAYNQSVVYKFESSDSSLCQQPTGTVGCIVRSTNGGAQFYPITASEVIVTNFKFYLVGSALGTVDNIQPRVTLTLSGKVQVTAAQSSQFNIQTSVTQRLYDQ